MSISQHPQPTPIPLLLLTGPTWPSLDFHRPSSLSQIWQQDRFTIHHRPLFTDFVSDTSKPNVESEEKLTHEVKTAFSVWDCSLILSKYLEYQSHLPTPKHSLTKKRVIELGSGRALLGLSAAILGANVTLTDVDAVVPTLHHVLKVNNINVGEEILPLNGSTTAAPCQGRVENVVGLDWTRREEIIPTLIPPPYDYILAADVVWVHDLIPSLVATIHALSSPTTKTLLAYQSRSTRADKALEEALRQHGLVSRKLDAWDLDPVYRKDVVDVFEIGLGKMVEGSEGGAAKEEL